MQVVSMPNTLICPLCCYGTKHGGVRGGSEPVCLEEQEQAATLTHCSPRGLMLCLSAEALD